MKPPISREEVNLEPTMPPEWEEQQPEVMRSLSAFQVVIKYMPDNGMEQGYDKTGWHPTEMIDLRCFSEAVTSYRIHSLYVKQILNNWATQNRIIPQDWKGLVTAVLETGLLMQWLTWWREEAANIEQ